MSPNPNRRLPALLALSLLAGCYRHVRYESPDGRKVEVVNVGFDTKIGRLSATTPEGSVELEGVDSTATLAAKLAELARALAEGGRP